MSRERNRFLAEPLHQASVAGNDIGEVIDEVVAESRVHQTLGERHADRCSDALPQRPRRGFHTGGVAIFGMSGRFRPPLPERLELIEGHALVAREVKQRVEQHGAVAGREHEAVAVRPTRIGRIELEETREQHGCDVSHAHGHAGMTRLGAFDGVDREKANGICHLGVGRFRASGDGRQH